MIPEYVEAIELLCQRLSTETLDEAVAIASLPDQVRGYETLKVTRATAYRAELADRMQTWATTR
jgi:indolepyruvate ferredoxin oxidoreductase